MPRFADRPEVEVETVVAASPAELWALISDIDVPARFSPEFQGGTWLEGGSPTVGARFLGRNGHPARGEWETTSEIVEAQPGRVFAWAVGDPERPSAVWRFDLLEQPGGTRLRYSARMGPGPSGVTMLIESMPDKEEKILLRRLGEWRDNMTATVEGIKALAEGG